MQVIVKMMGSNFLLRQYSNMYILEEPPVIALLAMLVNEAGGNVSVLCPLEQPLAVVFDTKVMVALWLPELREIQNTLRRALL
jgi:hypothetical protein